VSARGPLPAAAERAALPAADRMLGGSAFAIADRARRFEAQGHDVVHLELGQPDLPGPPAATEALARALSGHRSDYTLPAGDPRIRDQVADHYTKVLGRPVAPAEVVLLPGSNLALWFTLLAVLAPGDEVLLPDPGFPPYAELVRLAGAIPVGYPLRPGADYIPDPDEVAALISSRTRVLITNSPNNPTGSVWPATCLGALSDLAERHHLYTVHDQAYRELADPALIAPGPRADERTVIMDSLSKSHSMCGWRIGIAIVTPDLARQFTDILVNTNCCMPDFVQQAIPAALSATDHVARVPGLRLRPAHGGLYVFADVRAASTPDTRLAEDLLRHSHVATAPGSLYGPHGAGHLRLSLTQPRPRLLEGVARVRTHLSAALEDR
jgi:aspartate aminotransferase